MVSSAVPPMSADSGPPIDFATLDLLPYGVIVTDRDGTVLFYNEREEEIAGRSRADVVGRNFFTDIAPCTRVAAFRERFDQAVALNTVATFEFTFPFPGNPRAVEIAISGFDYRGSRLCTISVNDKTQQERVRAEVLQAERFRELGEVAATVAHSFNNLLMIIRGNADLLRDALPVGGLREQCQDIVRAADDGSALVRSSSHPCQSSRHRRRAGNAPNRARRNEHRCRAVATGYFRRGSGLGTARGAVQSDPQCARRH